jgi:hypothetical protein
MRCFATVLLTCVVVAASAHADPITACRAAHAGDSAAHIACLEDALRAAGEAQAQTQTQAPVTAAKAAPVAEVPAAVPVAPTVSAAPAATTAAPPPATAAAAPPPPAGLGAEQAKARQRSLDTPPEQAAVRIVAVRYTASGLGLFHMADGQIWLETVATPERHHLEPGREYSARIERGKVGGYRMYVDGVKWMHKVERLK